MAAVSPEQRLQARAGFALQFAIAAAPWAILVPLVGFGAFRQSAFTIGAAIAGAGFLLLIKQVMRYPTDFTPAANVTSLLDRLDASPVAGVAIELKGRIVGRGMPGYLLSPDLVIQDESGFVPVFYSNSLPFARLAFGLARAKRFLGKEVTVRGWYRRVPGPAVDLRDVHTTDGLRAKGWDWILRYAASTIVMFVGAGILLAGSGS
jgi:hypothetical protein